MDLVVDSSMFVRIMYIYIHVHVSMSYGHLNSILPGDTRGVSCQCLDWSLCVIELTQGPQVKCEHACGG